MIRSYQNGIVNTTENIEKNLTNKHIFLTSLFRGAGGFLLTSLWAGRSIVYLGVLIPVGTAPILIAGGCMAITALLQMAIKISLPALKEISNKNEDTEIKNVKIEIKIKVEKKENYINTIENEFKKGENNLKDLQDRLFLIKDINSEESKEEKNKLNKLKEIQETNIISIESDHAEEWKNLIELDKELNKLKKVTHPITNTLLFLAGSIPIIAAGIFIGTVILPATWLAPVLITAACSSIPFEWTAKQVDHYVLKGYFDL